MTTPIATFEDILAAMENNPRLQAALRQHVLDQEFLQLPAIVRELQQAVAQLTQLVHDYITATNTRLEQIEAPLARLEGDVTELKAGQARLEGNVNRLIGSDYERKAARRASRLAQRNLSLRDLHVIYAITTPDSNRLPELLDRAIAAGRIDADEADDLENADVILSGPDHYVVAETSVTVDRNDVMRARTRADLLARATAASVTATVIGAQALDLAVQDAAVNDVAIMILPE